MNFWMSLSTMRSFWFVITLTFTSVAATATTANQIEESTKSWEGLSHVLQILTGKGSQLIIVNILSGNLIGYRKSFKKLEYKVEATLSSYSSFCKVWRALHLRKIIKWSEQLKKLVPLFYIFSNMSFIVNKNFFNRCPIKRIFIS